MTRTSQLLVGMVLLSFMGLVVQSNAQSVQESPRVAVVSSAGSEASVSSLTLLSTAAPTASFFGSESASTAPPLISSLNPNQAQPSQTLNVVISGERTHFKQGSSAANFGPGITVNSLTVNNAHSTTANITVDPAAALGPRTVSVTTGSEIASIANGFRVINLLQITQLNPNSAQQGQTLDVAITAQNTHFYQGTSTASFGAGITVNSLTVTDATDATANITISNNAAAGARTVSVTTGNEVASISSGFTVTGRALISQLSPKTAPQGQALNVVISGERTHFKQGGSTANFGTGITVNSLTVSNAHSATANVSVDPAAAPGARTVSVTTGNEIASITNGFTVVGKPVITQLTPNTGQQGQTLTVAITGQYTHFVQGQSTASFGAGVTVTSLSVADATDATANITISSTAATGQRTVSVVTGSETASITNGFAVQPGGVGPPSITSFNPTSAPVGTLINVTGNNFIGTNNVGPQITLQQQGGGTIAAPVSTYTNTTLSFVVPTAAATGPITATVGSQTGTSSQNLTITTASSFSISLAPTSLGVIQGQSAAYSVNLTSTNGFNQLAALSVSSLPSGVTGSFSPTQITAGQTSILTVTAPTNQTLGTSNVTVTASATISGQSVTQTASGTLQVQAISTSFLGRTVVDDTMRTPIAGVTVTFLGVDASGNQTGCSAQTVSDRGGNFSFSNLPSSCTGPQLVGYDGTTATYPPGTYAGVNLSYTLTANQATVSPVLVHLPRLQSGEVVQVQQNASTNQVFAFQSIPGLLVTVYAGTTFTLQDGSQPNPFPLNAINVPVDRLPDVMPPSGMVMPFIVAFQPANAVASQPVAVNFPNTINTLPGIPMTLTTLDPTRGFMVPYGTGTVSSDGTRIVADPDPGHPGHAYGLVHFDWHGPMPPRLQLQIPQLAVLFRLRRRNLPA